jgi:hypothetical protein
MISSLNFLHMRKKVETLGNKLESPCVGVCAIFEKISKYVEGNHEGNHTYKDS